MDISVIISTHNRASKIGETLASVARAASQAKLDWELFLMDNQSTDNTREVVESFRTQGIPSLYYQYKQRGGKTTSLNLGIRRAKGWIVALLDDDVIVDPDWMKNLAAAYRKDGSIVAVGGRVELYNLQDSPLSIRTATSAASVDRTTFNPTNVPVTGCNMSFARRVFDEVGLFDDLLGPGHPIPAAEDIDMLWRVCRRDHAIHYVPDILVYHNHGRQSGHDAADSAYQYLFGRGAFYAKYFFRFDTAVLRYAFYEIRYALRCLFRSDRNWKTAISPGKYLRALFSGACKWCCFTILRPLRGSYPYDNPQRQ